MDAAGVGRSLCWQGICTQAEARIWGAHERASSITGRTGLAKHYLEAGTGTFFAVAFHRNVALHPGKGRPSPRILGTAGVCLVFVGQLVRREIKLGTSLTEIYNCASRISSWLSGAFGVKIKFPGFIAGTVLRECTMVLLKRPGLPIPLPRKNHLFGYRM